MNRFIIFMAALIASIISLVSCGGLPEGTSAPVASQNVSAGPEIVVSFEGLPQLPALEPLFQSSLWNGQTRGDYTTAVVAQKKQEAKAAAADSSDAIASGMPGPEGWYYHESYSGSEVKPGIPQLPQACFVVLRTIEQYEGGAHPMSQKDYFVFDESNMALLSLKGLLKSGGEAQLLSLADAALRTKAGIKADAALTSAGYLTDNPELTDNFFLDATGLGLSWPLYEIAPYAMGIIEVTIPYASVAPLLNTPAAASK